MHILFFLLVVVFIINTIGVLIKPFVAWFLLFVAVMYSWSIIKGIYDKKKLEKEKKIAADNERERREAEQRQREAAQKEREAEQKKHNASLIKRVSKTKEEIAQSIRECLLIDSNIWMDEAYDDLFKALMILLKEYKLTISFYGPQFDEITNIKNNFSYGDEKNIRARLAINRIEEFQMARLLRIKPIAIQANPRAYADPLIVKLLVSEIKRGHYCLFISNDKELRIRVREQLLSIQPASSSQWEIKGGDEFLVTARDIIEAQEIQRCRKPDEAT